MQETCHRHAVIVVKSAWRPAGNRLARAVPELDGAYSPVELAVLRGLGSPD
jgi:hypothetical protein